MAVRSPYCTPSIMNNHLCFLISTHDSCSINSFLFSGEMSASTRSILPSYIPTRSTARRYYVMLFSVHVQNSCYNRTL